MPRVKNKILRQKKNKKETKCNGQKDTKAGFRRNMYVNKSYERTHIVLQLYTHIRVTVVSDAPPPSRYAKKRKSEKSCKIQRTKRG